LQHRGQESCGIAYKNNDKIELLIRQGLISGNFFKSLPVDVKTNLGIGHVRYSTSGGSNLVNAQPFLFKCNKGDVAIAHNGNIPNADLRREELIKSGSIFQTTSDSEILIHLLARTALDNFESALFSALNQLNGAFSMLMIHDDNLIAFRDPFGYRPLCYGRLKNGYVFASETNALDLVGAEYVADVKPGEIIFCKNGEITKKTFAASKRINQCVFELIYFSRPDSYVFGESVHEVRLKMGERLALSRKCDPDIVIAVPDSGNSAALGFSRAGNIPFEFGIIRNHYTGRTFIKPGQNKREESVRIKLNPIRSVINGKKVAVVDDSLVRGTTSRKIVKMLRDAGAKEVHMFYSSPEIKFSCYYGIDTPTREELISSSNSPEEIAKMLGADSVTFLSIYDLRSCLKMPDNYCYSCFNGDYGIPIKGLDLAYQACSKL
jgi:amidophosphoribosyltransferase